MVFLATKHHVEYINMVGVLFGKELCVTAATVCYANGHGFQAGSEQLGSLLELPTNSDVSVQLVYIVSSRYSWYT